MGENSEKVLFIPDNSYFHAVLDLILAAQSQILIINFSMEADFQGKNKKIGPLSRALEKKALQGIEIKILLNGLFGKGSISSANQTAAAIFKKKSIKLRSFKTWRTIHAKIIIQDGEKMLIGSHNWTGRALSANLEASVLVKSSSAIQSAMEFFAKSWDQAADF